VYVLFMRNATLSVKSPLQDLELTRRNGDLGACGDLL
jgi:hypothetical protein